MATLPATPIARQRDERALKDTRLHVERRLEAPIIYVDAVPKFNIRAQILNVTLAVAVGEMVSNTHSADHLVAVASLQMTAATAHQLRHLLDMALLAMQPTPGSAN